MKPSQTENPLRAKARRTSKRYRLLLILPYVGLCFPALYARAAPTLFGLPFFYWYQFAWVILASSLIFLAYRKHSD